MQGAVRIGSHMTNLMADTGKETFWRRDTQYLVRFSAPPRSSFIYNACDPLIPRKRYEGLKEEGKLSKFMEKKRKKNAAKDHRWLPSKRQNRG